MARRPLKIGVMTFRLGWAQRLQDAAAAVDADLPPGQPLEVGAPGTVQQRLLQHPREPVRVQHVLDERASNEQPGPLKKAHWDLPRQGEDLGQRPSEPDEAMGVKRTRLPLLVACIGFTGAGLGFLMQWWMTAVDYPLVVQGKPYGAWESFVPITFELGILFSAFASLIGMLALNGLPRWHHPLMKKERFLAVSDDRFVVCIEAGDEKFDPDKTRRLLESVGGTNIDLVEDE